MEATCFVGWVSLKSKSEFHEFYVSFYLSTKWWMPFPIVEDMCCFRSQQINDAAMLSIIGSSPHAGKLIWTAPFITIMVPEVEKKTVCIDIRKRRMIIPMKMAEMAKSNRKEQRNRRRTKAIRATDRSFHSKEKHFGIASVIPPENIPANFIHFDNAICIDIAMPTNVPIRIDSAWHNLNIVVYILTQARIANRLFCSIVRHLAHIRIVQFYCTI